MSVELETKFDLLLIQYMERGMKQAIQDLIADLHPYDVGQIYLSLPDQYKIRLLTYLTPEQLALLIAELETEDQINILHHLGVAKSSKVMDLMENDDLANLLHEIGVDHIDHFLSSMKEEESEAVQSLMRYAPETAGRIMTDRYVWIPHHYTVKDVSTKLRAFAEIAESINYLYVINEMKQLVGVISYRDLILAHSHDLVADIMHTRVISVPATMDQEEVAQIFERYDFLAVPVIEENNVLVGIVTIDDIVDVVIQEANEDIEKLSASGRDIDFNTSTWTAAFRRLPWLIILLLIGLFSGSIISSFEQTLSKVVALAFFMPMIAGMTGNTGTQSLAVVVRGLISSELDRNAVFRLVLREFGVGIVIGVTCGILISVIAFVWQGNLFLGLVVGCSLFLTLIIGTLAGTVIPLILYKYKVDPAIASGPLITTINDIISLLIYFGLASLFISQLT